MQATSTREALEAIKGEGRIIVYGSKGEQQVNLLLFSDESWAIQSGGKIIGIWETAQQDECFRTFSNMCGANKLAPPAVLPLFPTHPMRLARQR